MTSADDVDDTHMSTLSRHHNSGDIHHILLSSGGDGGPGERVQ